MRSACLGLGLLAIAACALAFGMSASAETPITNTSTAALFVLEITDSPYVLDHDFHVEAGGFLLISDGVELRMDNGSKLVGDGGSISATGTALSPAVIGPRPLSSFATWGGIELQNGSTLTLRHARIVAADRGVTFLGIATLDAQFADFVGCAAWCVRTAENGDLTLRDSTMGNGSWGLIDNQSASPTIDNVSAADFSAGAMWFQAGSSAATVGRVTVDRCAVGLFADGLQASTFLGLVVRGGGTAVSANATSDVTIHNSSLGSPAGDGLYDRLSARLSIRDTVLDGGLRALSVNGSSALSLVRVDLRSPDGVCLYVLNMTNALLRGTTFDACSRTLAVDGGSAPPTADVDTSNTVVGKPVIWISNAAGVRVGVEDDAGLVVVSAVSGATLSDLRLRGAGVHIFGSTDVVVERVEVDDADAAVVAIGTRGLTVRNLVTHNVAVGIRVWSTAFFSGAQDVLIDGVRIDGAFADGIAISDTVNVQVLRAYSRAGSAGLNLTGVTTALVQYCFFANSSIGFRAADSIDITVVDSVIAGNTAYGAWVTNLTGYAARNAFLDNAEHASSPASSGFPFDELGGGNFWSGFTAPNANGDQFFDTPYNFTDGTGQDRKPRIGRLDFAPTAIVVPTGLLETGVTAWLNGSLSFDDFQVSTVYWTIVLPGINATGSGPLFPFTPPSSGNFTVIVEARDNSGSVKPYTFVVVARDTIAPTLGPITLGRPEVGTNLTISFDNATDNDPSFPDGVHVAWSMTLPDLCCLSVIGSATSLSFEVPVTREGHYGLSINVTDKAGNLAHFSVGFDANDTTPPEVDLLFTNEPDIGVPFMIDAAQARDPTGVDGATARWRWFDAAQAMTSVAWPSINITFADAGDHVLILTLCDLAHNCGNTSVTLQVRDRTGPRLVMLRVLPPQQNAIEVAPGENPVVQLKLNEETFFEIVSSDPSAPVTYVWAFSDGTSAQGARVSHRFSNLGTGVVTVTMTDAAGNSNTTALRINTEGGSIFDIIPGGALGLVILIAILGGGGVGVFALFKFRKARQKNY